LNNPKKEKISIKLNTWHDCLKRDSNLKCPIDKIDEVIIRDPVDLIAAKDYVSGMTDDFAEKCFDSINIYCNGAYEIAKSSDIMLPRRLHYA
jgi:hypothetical protein